jgi:hypothetical protein
VSLEAAVNEYVWGPGALDHALAAFFAGVNQAGRWLENRSIARKAIDVDLPAQFERHQYGVPVFQQSPFVFPSVGVSEPAAQAAAPNALMSSRDASNDQTALSRFEAMRIPLSQVFVNTIPREVKRP